MKNEATAEAPETTETADEPQEILHYHLLIRAKADDIAFERDHEEETDVPAKIVEYAHRAANGEIPKLVRPGETPYDLPVTRPCWIVVELDHTKKGWQFETNHPGVTPKTSGQGRLHRLKHVYAGMAGEFDIPPNDGCKVLYFAVKPKPKGQKCEFNLHTEFLQSDGAGGKKRLKIIIDPDVPNLGDPPPLNPPPPRD